MRRTADASDGESLCGCWMVRVAARLGSSRGGRFATSNLARICALCRVGLKVRVVWQAWELLGACHQTYIRSPSKALLEFFSGLSDVHDAV
jgi:hypothetical protein